MLLAGCSSNPSSSVIAQPSQPTTSTVSPTSVVTTRLPLTLTPTPPAFPTESQTVTPTLEPAGCQPPLEDYTRITVNGMTVNQRTLTMLQHAAALYNGEIDVSAGAITQGSYTAGVEASFGTHSGGGAVDISVMRAGTYTVLRDDLPALIQALRVAGFAAWVRELDELYPGSPIHIHAIAIGDAELSNAAQEQLTGPYGYFRGMSGLPPGYGGPSPDRYGGPVLCQWMLDLGYRDLREIVTPSPTITEPPLCCEFWQK